MLILSCDIFNDGTDIKFLQSVRKLSFQYSVEPVDAPLSNRGIFLQDRGKTIQIKEVSKAFTLHEASLHPSDKKKEMLQKEITAAVTRNKDSFFLIPRRIFPTRKFLRSLIPRKLSRKTQMKFVSPHLAFLLQRK